MGPNNRFTHSGLTHIRLIVLDEFHISQSLPLFYFLLLYLYWYIHKFLLLDDLLHFHWLFILLYIASRNKPLLTIGPSTEKK